MLGVVVGPLVMEASCLNPSLGDDGGDDAPIIARVWPVPIMEQHDRDAKTTVYRVDLLALELLVAMALDEKQCSRCQGGSLLTMG